VCKLIASRCSWFVST